jgi:glycosyltransferase involved in cell wall biosynthesis
VVFAANALGIGGTEKGMVHHALRLDRDRFDVRVVGIQQLGVRAGDLTDAGVRVDDAGGDRARLESLLHGADIVHVYRQGNPEPLLPAACRAAGVPVLVETNIFGELDTSGDEQQFASHLFLSQMCILRYRRLAGDSSAGFHRRNAVSYLPVDTARLHSLAPERRDAKRELGLDPDRPVVGRVGRAADLKWRDMLVDMLPPLVALVPHVQVLFVGATPRKERRIERRGMSGRVTLRDPVPDERQLAVFYAACDVFAAAAEIGESQGLAIAEAMTLGTPVVTCSTPWVDNAQIEFVDHGVTGWVANHPRPFAEAVADLLNDDARRSAFGAAGREKIESLLDIDSVTRQLEELYDSLLHHDGIPAEWKPSAVEVDRFESDYERRLDAEFRPLTRREALEARATRERERIRRLVAALGNHPLAHRLRRPGTP